jgi:hypothetical protein
MFARCCLRLLARVGRTQGCGPRHAARADTGIWHVAQVTAIGTAHVARGTWHWARDTWHVARGRVRFMIGKDAALPSDQLRDPIVG